MQRDRLSSHRVPSPPIPAAESLTSATNQEECIIERV